MMSVKGGVSQGEGEGVKGEEEMVGGGGGKALSPG